MKSVKISFACGTCKHYVQHYRKDEENKTYHAVYCGHCIRPRIKKRTDDTQACEHYLEKEET